MTTTIATSMTCGSCLAKLKPALDAEETITSWDADLEDPRKLVRVDLTSTGSPEHVLDVIRHAGFEANVVSEPLPTAASDAKATFRLATYKPLLLVVAYVIGASVLFESLHEQWQWSRAMNYFMGFFFLGFAFFKLLDVSKFADAFATYDVIAKRSRFYALAYPAIEVALGLMFVTGTWLVFAGSATAVVMAVGLVGVISAVRKKQTIQCACLGTAFNLPMSFVTIIENSVMLVMAIAMLAFR